MLEKLKKNYKLDLGDGVSVTASAVNEDEFEVFLHVSEAVLKPRMQNAWKDFDARLRSGRLKSRVTDFRNFTKPIQFSVLLRVFAEHYPGVSMEYVMANETARELVQKIGIKFEEVADRKVLLCESKSIQWQMGTQKHNLDEQESSEEEFFLKQTLVFGCVPKFAPLDLKKFKVKLYEVQVEDADVMKSLDAMRSTVTKSIACPPRAVKEGDTVVMDVRISGIGGQVEEHNGIKIRVGGTNSLLTPELQAQCIDKKPGDEIRNSFSVPKRITDPRLSGKALTMKAVIKEVKDTVFYEAIDEEFASALQKTLDELKAEERKKIETHVENIKFGLLGTQIKRFIVDNQKVKLPENFLQNNAKEIWAQIFNKAIPWNYDLAQYEGKNLGALRQYIKYAKSMWVQLCLSTGGDASLVDVNSELSEKEELEALQKSVLQFAYEDFLTKMVFSKYKEDHKLNLTEEEIDQAQAQQLEESGVAMQQARALGADTQALTEVFRTDSQFRENVASMLLSKKIIGHMIDGCDSSVTKLSFTQFIEEVNPMAKKSSPENARNDKRQSEDVNSAEEGDIQIDTLPKKNPDNFKKNTKNSQAREPKVVGNSNKNTNAPKKNALKSDPKSEN